MRCGATAADPLSDHFQANQLRCLNSRGRVGPQTHLFTFINQDCSCSTNVRLQNIRLEIARSDLLCLDHQVVGLSRWSPEPWNGTRTSSWVTLYLTHRQKRKKSLNLDCFYCVCFRILKEVYFEKLPDSVHYIHLWLGCQTPGFEGPVSCWFSRNPAVSAAKTLDTSPSRPGFWHHWPMTYSCVSKCLKNIRYLPKLATRIAKLKAPSSQK